MHAMLLLPGSPFTNALAITISDLECSNHFKNGVVMMSIARGDQGKTLIQRYLKTEVLFYSNFRQTYYFITLILNSLQLEQEQNYPVLMAAFSYSGV